MSRPCRNITFSRDFDTPLPHLGIRVPDFADATGVARDGAVLLGELVAEEGHGVCVLGEHDDGVASEKRVLDVAIELLSLRVDGQVLHRSEKIP